VLIERARDGGVEGPVYTDLCWITKSLGPVVEPRVLESLRPPRPRRLRRWLFEAITAETNDRRSDTKARFGYWWLKKPGRLQRRLIDFLDLLEFAFPRRDELRLRYGLDSKKAASAVYPLHTGKGLFLCAVDFLPWAYRVLRSRTYRLLEPWVPRQVSHRLRSYLGPGRS
jgi:hypothetical protein